MYEDANINFNWSTVFKRLLIIFILIAISLIMITLITKKSWSKPEDYFEDNFTTMISVAKNYYTQNDLNNTKITLQEMIDKKMLLEFVDENGNTCDTKKSYANLDNNKLTVYLKCSTKQDQKQMNI